MKLKSTYHRNGTVSHEIDGLPATQEEVDAAFPPKRIGVPLQSQTSAAWPIKSDALAVHPRQIKKVMERNRKHGLHVEYAKDGRPILADRGQRRELMKIEGAHDQQGGFGDDHATHGGYLDPIGHDDPSVFEGL